MGNLRIKPGCAAFRKVSTATGTFTVSHGLSFGTAWGTVDMYEVRVQEGTAQVTARASDYYTIIVTAAPCTTEVWPINYTFMGA